jgi:hypothetical protein
MTTDGELLLGEFSDGVFFENIAHNAKYIIHNNTSYTHKKAILVKGFAFGSGVYVLYKFLIKGGFFYHACYY